MLKVIGGVPDGEYKAIASGTLPNGKPVVVNADGTVSVAGETNIPESIGTPVAFESAITTYTAATFDTVNNKVIVAYRDNPNSFYGTAVVGTVSGTSISFGTPTVFRGNNSQYITVVAVPTDSGSTGRCVIAYRNQSDQKGEAVVGTISGTSITFGSAVIFNNADVSDTISSVLVPSTQNVVLAFRDQGNSSYAASIVGTVNSTSISFDSKVIIQSANTTWTALTYDTVNDKVVVIYTPYSSWWECYAKVGTLSGTSLSWGSSTQLDTDNTSGYDIAYVTAAFDPVNEKVLAAYRGNNQYGQARVGTVSGTSISFGSIVDFKTSVIQSLFAYYDPSAGKIGISYVDPSNSDYGTQILGEISGTSVTFGSATVFSNNIGISSNGATFDTNSNKAVFTYRSGSNSYGTAVVVQNVSTSTNLTAENYIGMSQGVVTETSEVVGTESVFDTTTNGILDSVSVYDPDTQKTIIAYADRDNGDAVTAVVATVTGTSLSFGTPVVADTTDAEQLAIAYDTTNDKVVITYRDTGNSNYGTSVVGTVSGTSITFGTPVVFHNASTSGRSAITFDENAGKIVIAYTDNANSNYGTGVVGTVSGNSISYGTETVFRSQTVTDTAAAYDANAQKVVIVFRDGGNLNRGTGIVGTVSGTSISFGTRQAFDTTTSPVPEADNTSLVYDPDTQKVICAFRDGNTAGDPGRYIVGTVSGTDISFGDIGIFSEDHVQYVAAAYDTVANKVVIAYRNRDNSDYGTVISGTVDGTDMTFDTPSVYSGTDAVIYIGASFNESAGSFVISYRDMTSLDGTAVAYQASYISRYPVADGDPARLDIIGSVSDNQLSLTAGEKYYVQTDGTISTTAGSPSVLAGTAISATKLVVKT